GGTRPSARRRRRSLRRDPDPDQRSALAALRRPTLARASRSAPPMAEPLPRAFGRDPSPADLPIEAERSLVERAARGDQRAVGALYDAYVGLLYRFCLARVGNETDAEDLTEEVFLKVMRSVGGFEWRPLPLGEGGEERSPFRAWIFRIARNHVVSHYQIGRASCRERV